MKIILAVFLTASAALVFAACGAPPANNTPANTNTNNARNAPTAPTVDALMALDKQANEAYVKGDSSFFEGFLSDKFAMLGMKGEHHTKADTVKMIGTTKCDVKSMDFTEPQMSKIDADTYVISYKATWDGTCTEKGKSMKIPSPVRAASIYVRSGEKWLGAWHGETPIMGEKAEPADKKAEAKKPDAKASDLAADSKTADTKPQAKSGEVKPDGGPAASRPADTKSDAKAADKAAGTAPAAKPADGAPMAADANTEALTKLHQAGWEGWRDKDAAKLTAMTAANLAFVSAAGMWFGTKDATIKDWTENDCKDIKNVKVSDGFATALSPTVELFFSKGTADGTCGGRKNGPLWGSAIYVKEGSDWKLAFLFESPA